jgi:hypothetical protein
MFSGCSSPSAKQEETKNDTIIKEENISKTGTDTFFVNTPSIIFMWPDSIQTEKLKSKDSDAFYTAADDYSFYNSELMNVADSLGIKNFSTSARYIDFNFTNNKHLIINRTKSEDLWWGLYLFNGIDAPELKSTVDIDNKFIKKYFKQ